MNELQIFNNPQFGEVRTITENGVTLFCGSDVARALGYKNPTKALADHCKGTVERRTNDSLGRQQTMKFIPEGDIYRLAARSELPGADAFERWIFDEVLPSIRKHGLYATESALEEMLSDIDTTIRLLQEVKEERAKRKVLEQENEAQRQAIADFEPKRQYLDTIINSPGTMAITQIAADYGMSAKKLNKILHEEGLQRCVNGQWILYREHMGKGYTKSETIPIVHADGTAGTKIFTKWSQKGRLAIHNILTARGILAVMDRTA